MRPGVAGCLLRGQGERLLWAYQVRFHYTPIWRGVRRCYILPWQALEDQLHQLDGGHTGAGGLHGGYELLAKLPNF